MHLRVQTLNDWQPPLESRNWVMSQGKSDAVVVVVVVVRFASSDVVEVWDVVAAVVDAAVVVVCGTSHCCTDRALAVNDSGNDDTAAASYTLRAVMVPVKWPLPPGDADARCPTQNSQSSADLPQSSTSFGKVTVRISTPSTERVAAVPLTLRRISWGWPSSRVEYGKKAERSEEDPIVRYTNVIWAESPANRL